MAGWSGWASLGGQLGGGTPGVGQNADGRLEVFADAVGAAGPELVHIWQDAASPSGWSGWDNLGAPPGQFMGAVAVGENADGRLEAFTRVGLMSTGVGWHIWQDPTPGSGWSAWDLLGAPPGGISAHFIVVASNGDGRLEAFVLGSAGDLWHVWQTAPASGWSGWDTLGTPPGVPLISLAVGQNADGRLEVFAEGTDFDIWHIWQDPTSPTSWSPWGTLGHPGNLKAAAPAIGRNADGRLELFALGSQSTVWHIWQDATSPTGWSGWADLGTPPGAAFLFRPAVGQNADGRLEVFVGAVGGELWHIWQDATSATGWSGWDSLGGEPDGPPGVGQNADGRLEVFVEARVQAGPRPLWHRWQVSPNDGWSFTQDWELTSLTLPARRLFTPAGGALYARTQAGLFRSDDAGTTWTSVNQPPAPGAVDVDPTDAAVIFSAGTGGLHKSTDAGATWALSHPAPGLNALAVAVSPADHNLVYLALGQGSGSFQFLRSQDGGGTWALLEGPLVGATCIWNVLILKPHPTDTQRVFRTSGCYAGRDVPFGDWLDQSNNQGASFAQLFHRQPFFPSRMVGGAGSAPGRYYLGAHFGAAPGGGRLYRSDAAATTWTEVLVVPSGTSIGGLAYDPGDPDRVYAGLRSGEVRTSADAGATWSTLGRTGLGQIEDLARGLDGQYLFAASDQGVWRLPL